jgi:hypothetical protein
MGNKQLRVSVPNGMSGKEFKQCIATFAIVSKALAALDSEQQNSDSKAKKVQIRLNSEKESDKLVLDALESVDEQVLLSFAKAWQQKDNIGVADMASQLNLLVDGQNTEFNDILETIKSLESKIEMSNPASDTAGDAKARFELYNYQVGGALGAPQEEGDSWEFSEHEIGQPMTFDEIGDDLLSRGLLSKD